LVLRAAPRYSLLKENAMRKLILIKHARPQQVEGVPPEHWGLSDEGREACKALAELVRPLAPAVIATSTEPKAQETARVVGEIIGVPSEAIEDLGEHDRTGVPLMATREFISLMALFFKQPSRLVLGNETADKMASRFQRAIDGVLRAHPDGNVAVASHGTVIAQFAADHGAGDPFVLWRKMGLPSLIAFSIPDYHVTETVDRV
jgi:broad specificity phosphatase PhoE